MDWELNANRSTKPIKAKIKKGKITFINENISSVERDYSVGNN
jgi:hypothetical protein